MKYLKKEDYEFVGRYDTLRSEIRQDMKDLVLLHKFGDNYYESICRSKENIFSSHLLDRIEDNLLELNDLITEVNKNEK